MFLWFFLVPWIHVQAATPLSLSQEVRRIISGRSCAHCHTPGLPEAKDAAIRVFDLSKDDWYVRVKKNQWARFEERLFANLSPAELKELGSGNPDPALTPEERISILNFVLERKSRSRADARPRDPSRFQ